MPRVRHCGDWHVHGPHIWLGPSMKRGETKQVEYQCKGTKRNEQDGERKVA